MNVLAAGVEAASTLAPAAVELSATIPAAITSVEVAAAPVALPAQVAEIAQMPPTASIPEVTNALNTIANLPEQPFNVIPTNPESGEPIIPIVDNKPPTTPEPRPAVPQAETGVSAEAPPTAPPTPPSSEVPLTQGVSQNPGTEAPAQTTPISAEAPAANPTATSEITPSPDQNTAMTLDELNVDGAYSPEQMKKLKEIDASPADVNELQKLRATQSADKLTDDQKAKLTALETKLGSIIPPGPEKPIASQNSTPDAGNNNANQALVKERDDLLAKHNNGTITSQESVRLNELKRTLNAQPDAAKLAAYEARIKNPKDSLSDEEMAEYQKLKGKQGSEADQNETATESTLQSKERLDKELLEISDDLSKGKITPDEARKKQESNIQKRRQMLDGLITRLQENDKTLTPFEREIAEKGARLKNLMAEIIVAPKQVEVLETLLKNTRKQYEQLAKFKLSPDELQSKDGQTKAYQNAAQREATVNSMSAQATNIAKYINIVGENILNFRSVNSSLEAQFGVRNELTNIVTQVGISLVRVKNGILNDTSVRAIARGQRTL